MLTVYRCLRLATGTASSAPRSGAGFTAPDHRLPFVVSCDSEALIDIF